MMRIMLLTLCLLMSPLAQAKLSAKETERRCQNLSFEKQKSHKVCSKFLTKYYSKVDPLFGKTYSKNQVKIKAQSLMGSISGYEAMMGYDFNQVEFGLFYSSHTSKDQEVGDFTSKNYGAYFQYNLLPYSKKRVSSFNPFMGAKLGQSSLLLDTEAEESIYPYLGLSAGTSYLLTRNAGVVLGVELHQIIHPKKNLFHIGSSLNLGIVLGF